MYGDPTPPAPEDRGRDAPMPHYTRDWQFDPYHQRLRFARQRAPAAAHADTEWAEWEVFLQAKRGEHHTHVGTVHAPDPDLALVLAKESFARRGPCVNLWVARARDLFATDYADADVFAHTTDKSYREPSGYQGLRHTLKHAGEADAEPAADPS
jgi:ring-1,2-phenylacetyl-CoA epoxidase subunit PaaB